MLFLIIRLVFFVVLLVVCGLSVCKSRAVHKVRWLMAGAVASILLTTAFALVPVENAFVTFSTPQAAYQYNHGAKAKLVVEGNESDLVVGAKGDTNLLAILPKSDAGWKMGMGTDVKRGELVVGDSCSAQAYRFGKTDDFYVAVTHTKAGPAAVTDSRGSVFQHTERKLADTGETYYTYYASVGRLDDSYTLTINGETVKIPA